MADNPYHFLQGVDYSTIDDENYSSRPQQPSEGYVNIYANNNAPSTGLESARDRMARVTREQWQDYVSRFFPLEDELIASYQNPRQRAERIATARGLSGSAFETATQGTQREAARYGLNLEDDPAYQRQLNMSRVAAEVDAANEARRHLTARDKMIMTGGLTGERGIV